MEEGGDHSDQLLTGLDPVVEFLVSLVGGAGHAYGVLLHVCTVYVRGGGERTRFLDPSFDVGKKWDQWEYVQTRTTPPFKAALAGKEGGYHSDQLLYNRSGSSWGVPVRPGWWCRACIWSTVHVCSVQYMYVRGRGTYQVPGSSFDVRVKNVQILVSCEISPHSLD